MFCVAAAPRVGVAVFLLVIGNWYLMFALAEQFAKGAEAAGHEVELVTLRGKEIRFCVGCLACQQTGACVFEDDVPAIMESVLNADVVCWATPIYYYEMSGQMKTLIDRMNAMYPKDYRSATSTC